MKHNSTDGVDGRPWSVYQHSPGCFSVARTKGDDLEYSSDKTLTEPEARRRCDALNAGVMGTPAADPFTVSAALRRLVADDAYAMTFQTFGQYRTALLKAIDAATTAAGVTVDRHQTFCTNTPADESKAE